MILYTIAKPLVRLFYAAVMPARIFGQKQNLSCTHGVIYCANHRHAYDPLLLAVHVRSQIHFMAKKELFEQPALAWLIRSLGGFAVDRTRADVSSIRTAVSHLQNGESIGIFPEGTRNHDTFGMQQIHGGAVWIALKSGAPIVPVFIDSRGAFRRTRFFVGEKLSFSLQEGQRLNAQTRDAAAQKLAESLLCLEKMAEKASNH